MSARRQAIGQARTRSTVHRRCRCRSTTGTGSAGRTRSPCTPSPNASGRTRACAVTDKSTRRRSSSTAANTRMAPDRRAIDASAETTPHLTVAVSAQRSGNDIVVSVGAAASGGATNATIVLLPYLASRDVAIGRGENAREKVTYTNVVRDIVPVAEWSGSAMHPNGSVGSLQGFRRRRGAAAGGLAGEPRRHSRRRTRRPRVKDVGYL